MEFKKIIALLAIAVMCLLIVACGDKSAQPESKDTISSKPTETEAPAMEEEPEVIETAPEAETEPEMEEAEEPEMEMPKEPVEHKPLELTEEQIEAAKATIVKQVKSKVYPSSATMKLGESKVFALAVKNVRPKTQEFVVEIRDVSVEERIGTSSYQKISSDIDIENWIDENSLSNFEVEANGVGVVPLIVTVEDMIKEDLETAPGMRVKFFVDIFEYDGGFTDKVARAELDIRIE